MSDIENDKTALAPLQRAMAKHIGRRVAGTADQETGLPDLLLFRREAPTEPDFCLIEPSVVLVVQGTKQMLIGEEVFPYDTTNFLITSLDLPARSQVIEASGETPCLGLVLKIDLKILAELIAQGNLPRPGDQTGKMGVGLGTMTPALMEPLKRLLDLLDEPEAIETLAPLYLREIHYRLLLSDQAALLRKIASVDSHGYRIAKAIDWLKDNFNEPLRIDELASRVQMSASSLHHHFRQLTGVSPLQYQKRLRLNEAKRLMLNEHLDASSAAFHVGYESPQQFSREYGRLFGAPPRRDIENLRHQADPGGH